MKLKSLSAIFFILLVLPLYPAKKDAPVKKPHYIISQPEKVKIFTSNKGMTVRNFVKTHKNAIAAINGTFFDKDSNGYFPTGLVISDGKLQWKSSIDVGKGKCRKRKDEKLVKKARKETDWYFVFYTLKESGSSEKAYIAPSEEFQTFYDNKENRKKVSLAFETGPLIVNNSKVSEENFNNRPSRNKKIPRSAMGILKNGQVVVYYNNEGQTFVELAEALIKLGAVQAVGLDGGSSSSWATPKITTKDVKVNTIVYVTE